MSSHIIWGKIMVFKCIIEHIKMIVYTKYLKYVHRMGISWHVKDNNLLYSHRPTNAIRERARRCTVNPFHRLNSMPEISTVEI